MAVVRYNFQRGEPVVFGDRIESGDLLAGHSMRARMKPVLGSASPVMPGDAVDNVSPAFTTSFVAAVGDEAAQFLHSLSAAQSLTLDAGFYLADSALLLDDVVTAITDPVLIVIHESASGQD